MPREPSHGVGGRHHEADAAIERQRRRAPGIERNRGGRARPPEPHQLDDRELRRPGSCAIVGNRPAERLAPPRAQAGVLARPARDRPRCRPAHRVARPAARQRRGDFVTRRIAQRQRVQQRHRHVETVCRSAETIRGSGGITVESSRRNDSRASARSSPRSEPVTLQPLLV